MSFNSDFANRGFDACGRVCPARQIMLALTSVFNSQGGSDLPLPLELRNRIQAIADEHETNLSALIPVLREVQGEFGWLCSESMEEVAEILDIPPSSVQNVASFYTMFFTEPVGDHVVWLCRTLSCALRGAESMERHICKRLGVGTGETTADGKITLMEAECLASCGTAPVMLVDDTLYENLTEAKIDEVMDEMKKDK